ncbi:hypothetical protein CRENBAI_009958 [Crenichthys baileyi]|uniref:Uncharacterized protein n=1 Tax=Crenichthys baileyi TaxID=28760 RepID=A0AAV9QNE2_9TELE
MLRRANVWTEKNCLRGRDEEERGNGRGERGGIAAHPCVNVTNLTVVPPSPPSSPPLPASSGSVSPHLQAGITRAVLGGQAWIVESRLSRLGALLQGLGGAQGNSFRFLPGFVTTAADSHGSERRERRGSTRSRMPVMRGLIAPQNTFLDTIATRFDGTR